MKTKQIKKTDIISDYQGVVSKKELCEVCKKARKLTGISRCILCLREKRTKGDKEQN